MLTIKEIDNNWNNTKCNSCGKSRRKYYEIRYGIPVSGQPWQPYSTLPICRSCMGKLYASIERKLSTADRLATNVETLLKEQEQRIKELESMKITATDNGTAIGVVRGGLVIQQKGR